MDIKNSIIEIGKALTPVENKTKECTNCALLGFDMQQCQYLCKDWYRIDGKNVYFILVDYPIESVKAILINSKIDEIKQQIKSLEDSIND